MADTLEREIKSLWNTERLTPGDVASALLGLLSRIQSLEEEIQRLKEAGND